MGEDIVFSSLLHYYKDNLVAAREDRAEVEEIPIWIASNRDTKRSLIYLSHEDLDIIDFIFKTEEGQALLAKVKEALSKIILKCCRIWSMDFLLKWKELIQPTGFIKRIFCFGA